MKGLTGYKRIATPSPALLLARLKITAFKLVVRTEISRINLASYLYLHMSKFSLIRQLVTGILDVTEEEWNAHEQALIQKNVKKGDYVLTAGDVCDHVSFVNLGCFRYYNMLNDEEVTTQLAFEGEYISDYKSFLTRTPAFDNIIALEDSEILQLDYHSMQQLYERYPVWQKFGRLIAETIFIASTDRWQSLLLQSPEQRYLELMRKQPHILNRVSLKYIASFLGVAPESLSRIRKRISQMEI